MHSACRLTLFSFGNGVSSLFSSLKGRHTIDTMLQLRQGKGWNVGKLYADKNQHFCKDIQKISEVAIA